MLGLKERHFDYTPTSYWKKSGDSKPGGSSLDWVREHDGTVNCDGATSHIQMPFHRVAEMAEAVADGKFPWNNATNKERGHHALMREKESFTGGSYKSLKSDLEGNVDMSVFENVREKIEKTGIVKKLQARLQAINPRRKRRLSEHDGDWDWDRRFEIQPFNNTTKSPQAGRVIDIVTDFSINCSINSDAINEYGALLWCVNDIVERCGILTRIVWIDKSGSSDSGYTLNTFVEIEIKKPGQYFAPTRLAALNQSNFYRRMGFSMLALACDVVGKGVNTMFGYPYMERRSVVFEEGKLKLYPDMLHASVETLEKELLKALA